MDRPPEPARVLAVDPSLRSTGYAVLDAQGSKYRAVTYGIIKNPPTRSHADCLVEIFSTMESLITAHAPTEFAVEGVIFVQSYPTAIVLGAARGAALVAAGRAKLSIHEYAPRRVKQAIVGAGGAQKHQVGFMVRALLGLTETPPPDAADALAIAITHAQTRHLPPTLAKRRPRNG
jgi:crossover junction endodeoxyribonuclease RuvC